MNPTILQLLLVQEHRIQRKKKQLSTLLNSYCRVNPPCHKAVENEQRCRSTKSAQSNGSKRSSASSVLTQQRLQLVRQKQRSQDRLRKQLFMHKMESDSRKSLKAQQQVLSKSRRIKNRAEASRQIVRENQEQIDHLSKLEMREHMARLNFKIQRTEMIRMKNLQRKSITNNTHDGINSLVRQSLDQEKSLTTNFRYEAKQRRAEDRLRQASRQKEESLIVDKFYRDLKGKRVQNGKVYQEHQQKLYSQVIRNQKLKRQTMAQIIRQGRTQEIQRREKGREEARSIAYERRKQLEMRKTVHLHCLNERTQGRFRELNQIEDLKQNFIHETKELDSFIGAFRSKIKRYSKT